MERKGWSPLIVLGIGLGAALGGILALLLIRRRRGGDLSFGDVPWRDLIALVSPLVVLARRLIEISRREMIELENR